MEPIIKSGQRVKVEPVKDSRLATVKLEDADPERAQRVLNALIETYVAMNLEDVHASTTLAVMKSPPMAMAMKCSLN